MKAGQYIETIGRRKDSTARVRVFEGKGTSTVNGKPVAEYIDDYRAHKLDIPFKITNTQGKYYYTVKTSGGGVTGQVDAIQLGIARALVEIDESNKALLKKQGLLTRDPRQVERKKYFLVKARKRPQYSKR